ncbi:unnamed protein product [Malus baccata var. baccata]
MKKRIRSTSQFVQFKKRKKNYYVVRKGKNEGDYNSLDRISLLRDELLVSMLSLLPLKEATSTSILSRRWRYVWASTMNLVFDSGFNANPCLRLHTFSPKQRKKQARSYVDWVNSRACFELDDIFTSSIDECIEFAMNKRVEILELDFFFHTALGLGQVCTSKLEHSHPENPSRYSIGFESLKVFQEMLEYLISNCPVLERLSVSYTTNNLYLAIESCLELKSIEIHDVNLVSFYYRGGSINLACGHIHVRLSTVYCENLYFQNRTFPTLTSLRQLKLEFVPRHYRSLCWLASSMKACPYLERLVLKQGRDGKNNYLKVVEIIGHRPQPCVTQYVKFLIENMVGLEKIIVDPVFHHWSLDRAIFRYDFPIEEAQAREHAMQHLEELVPLTVEFVCL